MRVYIGYDKREHKASEVAIKTLKETSKLAPELLDCTALAERGLLTRFVDRRGSNLYDLASNAYASTDFAISRFLVPILCQSGWALFTDCDVVFLRDVHKLLDLADDSFAVQVVKHVYKPTSEVKMDNKPQVAYARKNWSSVMLFNCSHPANRRLTLHEINNRSGLYLHQFRWLHDSEIGDLPGRWNWLVNETPRPSNAAIAHFTLGGPWLQDWVPHDHDDIWLGAASYGSQEADSNYRGNGFTETFPAERPGI